MRTTRGQWTWRALGTMTPLGTMNWMMSTRALARATSSRSRGWRRPSASPRTRPVTLPTTAAALPVTAVQPVATPFETSPTEDTVPEQTTGASYIPRVTEAPVIPSWKATTTSTTASEAPSTTTTTTTTTTTAATTTTTATTTTATSTTTVATAKPTTVRRFLPPFVTKAATTRATTLETPTTAVLETSTPTEVATTQLVPSSTAKPRSLPKPSTPRTADLTEKSTALPSSPTTLPPTEAPQVEPGEVSTVLDSDLEVPVSSGPSGDFEIREEEETTRPELGNEVVAVVTPPSAPGPGRNAEPGLIDNTIESGSSGRSAPPEEHPGEEGGVDSGDRGRRGGSPLRCLPRHAAHLPDEEEGRGQLHAGGTQASQRHLPEAGQAGGVLRVGQEPGVPRAPLPAPNSPFSSPPSRLSLSLSLFWIRL
uniref:Syndecan 3 n=1 Tax=Anas platyrhynchos TaxID=8839 RepID=A0A8B9TF85_ANAPL